jgi:transposase InsO family protein
VRFAFVEQRAGQFPVKLMCQLLDVSRSGYYAWRRDRDCDRDCDRDQAGASQRRRRRRERRAALTEQIRQAFQDSRATYGSPRVTAELKARGVAACENTVAKYMREQGLYVKRRRRFVPRTTDAGHPYPIAPNLLDRDFTAPAPDRKWACDLTYVWTDEGWLYLSVVLDLFSRRVVGWALSEDLRAEGGPLEALRMALRRRRRRRRPDAAVPDGRLLHHSDRGVQYACESYRRLIAEHGIRCSMSRPGNCYDNAVVESFFGTFKVELVHRRRYRTRAEARDSLFEWIECWYNRRRRHSSLRYLSPEAFEAQLN